MEKLKYYFNCLLNNPVNSVYLEPSIFRDFLKEELFLSIKKSKNKFTFFKKFKTFFNEKNENYEEFFRFIYEELSKIEKKIENISLDVEKMNQNDIVSILLLEMLEN